MTKRIAVVAMDVRLPGEAAGLDREEYIARTLAAAGYEVELITSAFQHWEKRQRDTSLALWRQQPYQLTFIPARTYERNITPARIVNHAQVARRVRDYLATHTYDAVFAKVPPNDLARVCAEYAEHAGVPLVADVNDLWPEAMRMVAGNAADVLLAGMRRDADYVYTHAAAVVGTSERYAARALAAPGASGTATPPRTLVVHVGCDITAFDAGVAEHAADVPPKPEGEFWATYAGTLGKSYALSTLVRAAALAARQLPGLRVNVLGGGPEEPALRALAAQTGAPVKFLGYKPHAEMAAWLAASDVCINSFGAGVPQSIVSKIGDYLAAARPMINTLYEDEFCAMVTRAGFGINVPPEQPVELAAALLELAAQPETCTKMGAAARKLALAEFDRPQIYARITALMNDLIGKA